MAILSILDLSPINEGGTVAEALNNSRLLAQHAETLGYHRYWVAEHHNMKGIASAATSILISHIASGTQKIRVGSGGIMLPNHAPLMVAEQFGTLSALFPGRIDLGLGRAPGTDGLTAHALRRTLNSDPNGFPKDVLELQGYLAAPKEDQKVTAVPGFNSKVPLYILGSSLFGAQLAAILGLPFAFASHFAPAAMMQAIGIYREEFCPSEQLDAPHLILGFNACAAKTESEAIYHKSSGLRALLNLRQGNPGPLPRPVENFDESLTDSERQIISQSTSASAVGNKSQIQSALKNFLDLTDADELIITSQIFDHQARCDSYSIVWEALNEIQDDLAFSAG